MEQTDGDNITVDNAMFKYSMGGGGPDDNSNAVGVTRLPASMMSGGGLGELELLIHKEVNKRLADALTTIDAKMAAQEQVNTVLQEKLVTQDQKMATQDQRMATQDQVITVLQEKMATKEQLSDIDRRVSLIERG